MVDERQIQKVVESVFGERTHLAVRFYSLLAEHGVTRGLIGPREVERLWERHILNSAVIGEHIADGSRVVDVGSGAGLPGIPLAIARPDLDVVLLEPMERRVAWLNEVVDELDLPVEVVRGRAEQLSRGPHAIEADVVTARAVAPLGKLAGWCLPLVRPGGAMLALKGAGARDEIARDSAEIVRLGGSTPTVVECGAHLLEAPTTVVVVQRSKFPAGRANAKRAMRGRRRTQ